MKLDFKAIKRIPITAVVWKYRVKLFIKTNGDGKKYGSAVCPLPSHKEGDKAKNFSVDIAGNFWKCWSDSCNQNNGGKKGGDCINFVAAMDGISQLEAAQKLSDWFGIGKENPAPNKSTRDDEKGRSPHHLIRENTPVPAKGQGYMRDAGELIEQLLSVIADEAERYRIKKVIMSKIRESYDNGKVAR